MLPEKLYYRIGEVAEYLDVEPSTLRYWEKEFRQIRPVKRNNERLYRPEDVETLELIKFLLKEEKYTIEGARAKLAKRKGYVKTKRQMLRDLEQLRDMLKKWRDNL